MTTEVRQYRLAILYDVHVDGPNGRVGWAYWRRATAIQRWAPPDFSVDIFPFAAVPWHDLGNYNIALNLEYASPSRRRIPSHVPLVISFNSDSRRRAELWTPVVRQADFVICNNYDVWAHFGKQPKTCAISNGVDTEIFRPTVPIVERPHRLLWSGSKNPKKGKGWEEVLKPLMDKLPAGFECSFRTIDQIDPEVVYNTQQQVDWYNSGSYVLCASLSEGTPGIITEGVACGCVAVTVPVGNCREWGKDRENCVLVQRTVDSFIEGLLYAREHRERLSAAGMEVMQNRFSYGPPGERANYFFSLFRRIVNDGPDSVKPFAYNEINWKDI